jgi:hypothetical protein
MKQLDHHFKKYNFRFPFFSSYSFARYSRLPLRPIGFGSILRLLLSTDEKKVLEQLFLQG